MSKRPQSAVSVEKHGETPELAYDEFVATLPKTRAKPEPRVPVVRRPLTTKPGPRDRVLAFASVVPTPPPPPSRKAIRARRRAERRRAKDCRTIAGIETLAADLCVYCNAANPTTHDHIEPVSRGGAHELENLARCCWRCNKAKGTKSLLVFLAGRRRP